MVQENEVIAMMERKKKNRRVLSPAPNIPTPPLNGGCGRKWEKAEPISFPCFYSVWLPSLKGQIQQTYVESALATCGNVVTKSLNVQLGT